MLTEPRAPVPPPVPSGANPAVNRQTVRRLERCSTSNALVSERLNQLRGEWDVDRVVGAAAAAGLLAAAAVTARNPRWGRWLPVAIGGLLLQHTLRGWSPCVPLLRRLGVRTAAEIARERYALKGMRGDFAGLGVDRGRGCAMRAFRAARPR